MGHTRKARFAAVLGAGLLLLGAETTVTAQSGLSARLALSNVIFTQHVGSIEGTGFTLFIDKQAMADKDVAVSRLHFTDATITDLCMSAPINLPGLGEKKFQMMVPGTGTTAHNLVIRAESLAGSLSMDNVQIGVDATQLSEDAIPGSFGINATNLNAIQQDIRATSIAADKLSANGGTITIEDGDGGQC